MDKKFLCSTFLVLVVIAVGCNREDSRSLKPTESQEVGHETSDRLQESSGSKRGVSASSTEWRGQSEFQMSSGTIVVHEVALDTIAGSLELGYSFSPDESTWHQRNLRVGASYGSNCRLNILVSSQWNELLAGCELIYPDADSIAYSIMEWAGSDTLTLDRVWLGDAVAEMYSYQYDSFAVQYTPTEAAAFEASNLHRNPREMASSVADPRKQESAFQRIEEFQQFLPTESALFQNVDGQAAMELLCDAEFQLWLEDITGHPGLVNADKVIDDICELASVGTFKCYLGGLMNFICIASAGTSIACFGYAVYNWLT